MSYHEQEVKDLLFRSSSVDKCFFFHSKRAHGKYHNFFSAIGSKYSIFFKFSTCLRIGLELIIYPEPNDVSDSAETHAHTLIDLLIKSSLFTYLIDVQSSTGFQVFPIL